MIKVLHLSANDNSGGAAKASNRIYKSLANINNKLIESKMRVINKITKDNNVIGGRPIYQNIFQKKINPYLVLLFKSVYKTTNQTGFSTGLLKTGLGKEINNLYESKKIDIVNLHWLGDYTLSIEEIGKLKPPIVWTLHDQWPFCGTEHYSDLNFFGRNINKGERFISGYKKLNRNADKNIKDLNRFVWLKKKNLWNKKMYIVCPSKWMEDCVKESSLMQNWPTKVIPNPIDINFWIPINKKLAKKSLNLPEGKQILLYMSSSGNSKYRKGTDLFIQSIEKLKKRFTAKERENIELLIFGESDPFEEAESYFKYYYIGSIKDEMLLRLVYSAADVFFISSRQDNLPNVGIESHSCATPVVAFNTGGLGDIIKEGETGFLAKSFVVESLSSLLYAILSNQQLRKDFSHNARERSVNKWSMNTISKQYLDLYLSIMN